LVAGEHRVRTHGDLHDDVAALAAVRRWATTAAQSDLLPIGHAGGDLHLERLAVLALQGDGLTLDGGDEVDRRPCGHIGPALGTAEAAEAAAGLTEAAGAEAPAA